MVKLGIVRQIRSLLESLNYEVPHSPEVTMYDFYVLAYCDTLSFTPSNDKMGRLQGSFIGRGDSKENIDNALDKLLPFLKRELLSATFTAIAAEMRHLGDQSQSLGQLRISNEDDKRHLRQYSRRIAGSGGNLADVSSRVRDHSGKYGGRSAAYNDSANHAEKSFPSRASFVAVAESCFRYGNWRNQYGGAAWANICGGYLKLNNATRRQDLIVYIDHLYDLEHNTGTVFNKVARYASKGGDYQWIKKALDAKASFDHLSQMYPKCSSYARKIAQAALKEAGKPLSSLADVKKEEEAASKEPTHQSIREESDGSYTLTIKEVSGQTEVEYPLPGKYDNTVHGVGKAIRHLVGLGTILSLNDLLLTDIVFPKHSVFSSITFARSNLSGSYFPQADFAGAFFDGTEALGCDFEGASFGSAIIKGSDFSGSSFKEAAFLHTEVSKSSFIGVDMSKALFRHTVWDAKNEGTGSIFSVNELSKINGGEMVKLGEGAGKGSKEQDKKPLGTEELGIITKGNKQFLVLKSIHNTPVEYPLGSPGITFSNTPSGIGGALVMLGGLEMKDNNKKLWLDGVVLDGVNFLSSSSIGSLSFNNCRFNKVSFDGVRLLNVEFHGTTAENCSFKKTKFVGGDINYSDMVDSSFEGAKFGGVTINKSIFSGSIFTSVEFEKSKILESKLPDEFFDSGAIKAINEGLKKVVHGQHGWAYAEHGSGVKDAADLDWGNLDAPKDTPDNGTPKKKYSIYIGVKDNLTSDLLKENELKMAELKNHFSMDQAFASTAMGFYLYGQDKWKIDVLKKTAEDAGLKAVVYEDV